MTTWHVSFAGIAAFCAVAMNSVAGGGTFFSRWRLVADAVSGPYNIIMLATPRSGCAVSSLRSAFFKTL